ncbi:rhomboid family intramembrane serine protease [Pseudomaricurvus sp.]|uniref:rhomboid family intramembrane serine protease n=1 Tax=Pseudomaricurvus sp. TaxID=2004510 RepID=UPI003F6D3374
MVILPTEKRFDWQYAPVMLFSLVLLNVLVFFLYQSGDDDKFTQALKHYQQSQLLRMEWPAYQDYLSQDNEQELLQEFREDYDTQFTDDIIYHIVIDDEFLAYLNQHADKLVFDPYDEGDNWENWNRQRERVGDYIGSISSLSLGLIPDQLNPLTFITYQFLHGDFMHLLGNIFFLVICGFAVEAALGAWLFLGLYLASGIFGGLLFALVDLQSGTPLVGASGSISGVMAMYLGVFRLKKIEFFYWIFIFAGYFRAPALLILPFYIGKELVDFFLVSDSNVAFLAHAGGFVSGGILTLLAYYFKPGLINHDYVEEDQSVDPRRQALAGLYERIETIRFPEAIRQVTAIIEEYGKTFELAALRFNLMKVTRADGYENAFDDLIQVKPKGDQEITQLAKIWQENPELHARIDRDRALKLGLIFSTAQHIELAERIFGCFYDAKQPCSSVGVLAR